MASHIIATIERYFFATLLTIVALVIAIGLIFWIYSDRFTRHVPAETDLVRISGLVVHVMAEPRSGVVWIDLKESRSSEPGLPEVTAVRLYARDPQGVATALSAASGVKVAAWAVRDEIDVATSQTPPSALQLHIAENTLISYSEGRSVREELSLSARTSAWMAGSGAIISLAVLMIFWIQRSRT